jgi:small subunit ribosomal protein S10
MNLNIINKNSSRIVKITFKMKTYHNYNLKKIMPKILYKILSLNIKTTGFVSLPTKLERFTVLRSPHVDKKSREQFEKKIYSKTISVFFNFSNIQEKQNAKLLINFIKNSSTGLILTVKYSV